MKNYIHTFTDFKHLQRFMAKSEMHALSKISKSMLVQIFSASGDTELIREIVHRISDKYPHAVIAGVTTAGEITDGHMKLNSIVMSFSVFSETSVKPVVLTCRKGAERDAGEELIRLICDTGVQIAGVLLLATPRSIDMPDLFAGMHSKPIPFPVFGGGAGYYDEGQPTLVFCGDDIHENGVVAVVFLGNSLNLYAASHLGWQPLTKEMTVTDSDGMQVNTIDGQPAYDLYKKYLGIKEEDNFFLNVLEFPFLVDREGSTVARVPFFKGDNGSIIFTADVNNGEKFRIGYGDPQLIVKNAESLQKELHRFSPDVIFIYSCICRRFLMQGDVNLEIHPLEAIADTVGFFTHGEYLGSDNQIRLLNSTTVAVGMREGPIPLHGDSVTAPGKAFSPIASDPYSDKHTQIVSRLLHFISALTSELESANNELTLLSEIDKLTQICNRRKLDQSLAAEIARSERFHNIFSIILFDIDKFKEENDKYGHISGDTILIELARFLKEKVRKTDTFGRWGGDEFLVILPMTDLDQACAIADQLRKSVSANEFTCCRRITGSFGATSYQQDDSADTLISRADKALYRAKSKGRDRVESESP
jgi:diguanylate cyclase (GGDEF)-like protein